MAIRIDQVTIDFLNSKRVVWFTEPGREGQGHRLELDWIAEDDLRAQLTGEVELALAPGVAAMTKAALARELDDMRREVATLADRKTQLEAENAMLAAAVVDGGKP